MGDTWRRGGVEAWRRGLQGLLCRKDIAKENLVDMLGLEFGHLFEGGWYLEGREVSRQAL